MEYVEDEFCNKSLADVMNCSLEYSRHMRNDTVLRPEAVAVPLAFAVIFVVGVTGNVLLILNFARHKKLSTPHNALVVNLAAGDLLMLFIGVPFNSVWYTFPSWKFGNFICKLSRVAETWATGVTIATLAVLSVERYYIVTGRRRHHPLSSVPKRVIVAIWVLGCLLASVDFISARVVAIPNENATTANMTAGAESDWVDYCLDYNPDWGEAYPKAIVMVKFLLYFCIPLLIIAPFYLLLAFHLFYKMFGSRGAPTSKTPLKSTAMAPPESQDTTDDVRTANDARDDLPEQELRGADPSQNEANSLILSNNVSDGRARETPTRKRQRLAVTVLGLVVCFVLCWLPRHVFLLWFHYDPEDYNAFWHVVKITAFCLMFSNSAINPFVFFVLDLHFRAFVRSTLFCRPSRNDYGSAGRGGGGENGVVDTTITEADRRACLVMKQMPPCADRVDSV